MMDAPTTPRATEDADGREPGATEGQESPAGDGNEPPIPPGPSADAVLVRRTLAEIAPVAEIGRAHV